MKVMLSMALAVLFAGAALPGATATCGEEGSKCCYRNSRTFCNGTGLFCSRKTWTCKRRCGKEGQPLCPGRGCNASFVPDSTGKICVKPPVVPTCGKEGGTCCEADDLPECERSTNVCGDEHTCIPCGEFNEPACMDPSVPECNEEDLTPDPHTGLCVPCGDADDICCASQSPCNTDGTEDLVCTEANVCEPCGGVDEPACEEPREPCDHGLSEDDDGICIDLGCGNGHLDAGEQCEPPNTGSCSSTCQLIECPATPVCPPEPECGNRELELGEQCEPPNTETCDAQCQTRPFCGDTIVQTARGEECEPPNTGACDATCRVINLPPPLPPAPVCGDEVLQAPEQCDPPNGVTCDENCRTIESICGDGIIDPDMGEGCEPPDTPTCDANCQPIGVTGPPGCKGCGETGKPTEVVLQWACEGAPPTEVSGSGKKGGVLQYEGNGVLRIGGGGEKLGSQQDFTWSGPGGSGSDGIHVSCSAPFGLGVRTIGRGEDKKCQGGCEGPACTGCWVVIDATSESGDKFCELDCAADGKGGKGGKSGKGGKVGKGGKSGKSGKGGKASKGGKSGLV